MCSKYYILSQITRYINEYAQIAIHSSHTGIFHLPMLVTYGGNRLVNLVLLQGENVVDITTIDLTEIIIQIHQLTKVNLV